MLHPRVLEAFPENFVEMLDNYYLLAFTKKIHGKTILLAVRRQSVKKGAKVY